MREQILPRKPRGQPEKNCLLSCAERLHEYCTRSVCKAPAIRGLDKLYGQGTFNLLSTMVLYCYKKDIAFVTTTFN